MILDKSLVLSDAQALTTTAASTNIVDQLAEGQAIEPGTWLYVNVQTAFVIAGAPETSTITVQLHGSDNENMLASYTLATSAAIEETALTAGASVLKIKLPLGLYRYLRVYYVLGGTASAGNMDAYLCQNVDNLITDNE